MSSNVPIQSTAGAVPLKNEKGQVYMQKVKVNRYVTGKRPDYAADSSSEESDDEFELQRQKKAPKEEPVEQEEKEPEVKDRRLRRLQDRETTQDSDEEDRVTRHRREVIEPELIQEGSDSETEARGRRDEEDSDAENEDIDEEEIERRRALLRQRALQRQEEEEILDVEEEKDDAESDEESSEYEEYSDSEEETGPRLKPVFVRKKDRITIQEKEREELKQKQLEIEAKKLAEDRRKQTLKMVADEARREIEEEKIMAEACDQLESSEENDEEEYEAWKVRELRRLKRDKEERETIEKEKSEIERMRNMTEEDRRQDLKLNPKTVTNKAPKGKYKFLQKYYHRGAFFLDADDDRLQQDFSSPTLEDHFNKTVLPKVMQVKNFGRSGRTKYTHLVDQDTTQFDAPWMTDTSQNLKFHTAKGGGMKQSFERPSGQKKK
ncbi:microfibrillar-associated protein 1-like [Mytilus californianus]|uniref:MFAP1 n=1 Tax=Mytilus coruscus TaxID=42192 RepID=A0A6J8BDD5_MYTCO|nr:microfibrillar-associated protein 1-like [Mytilus californianus]CAC5381935.1 MFAP1 [Mytilus coruscus]